MVLLNGAQIEKIGGLEETRGRDAAWHPKGTNCRCPILESQIHHSSDNPQLNSGVKCVIGIFWVYWVTNHWFSTVTAVAF